MCSLQGFVILVQSAHDGLPTTTSVFKLFALSGQLLPDILSLKNVLEWWEKKKNGQLQRKIVVVEIC